MKAARTQQFGPPSKITIDERPRLEPGAGELLVRVKAAWVRGGMVGNAGRELAGVGHGHQRWGGGRVRTGPLFS